MKRSSQNTRRLAYGAVLAALIVLFFGISAVFPSLDLTLAALSALVIYVLLLEFGGQTALLCFLTSAVLAVLLLPEKSCAIFYICFFGWYPFLRHALRRVPLVLAWGIKILCAILAEAVFFFFCTPLVSDVQPHIGTAALCFVAFVLYEIGLSKLILFYVDRIRPKLRK